MAKEARAVKVAREVRAVKEARVAKAVREGRAVRPMPARPPLPISARRWPGARWHDALRTGEPSRTPRQSGRSAWDAFRTLDAFPRRAVLDQALQRLFSLDIADHGGPNASAGLKLGGATIVTLEKPSDAFLAEAQLPFLRSYADLRLDRLAEIQVQTSDILSFFATIGYMHPDATKWTHWMAGAVLRLCTHIEMPLKMAFDVARPITMSDKVQPIIQTPGHGSWPSGHATEAFASATILSRLFEPGAFSAATAIAEGTPLYRHAARIAANRTVAGVHFPTDSMAGAILGTTMAEALVNLLDGAGETPVRTFHGAGYDGDFTLSDLGSAMDSGEIVSTTATSLSEIAVPPWLTRMWDEAKDEY